MNDDNIKGCLFIGDFGIYKVYCEFLVICLEDIHQLSQGDVVSVSDVKYSESGKMVYVINGNYYYHHYFALFTKSPNDGQSTKSKKS